MAPDRCPVCERSGPAGPQRSSGAGRLPNSAITAESCRDWHQTGWGCCRKAPWNGRAQTARRGRPSEGAYSPTGSPRTLARLDQVPTNCRPLALGMTHPAAAPGLGPGGRPSRNALARLVSDASRLPGEPARESLFESGCPAPLMCRPCVFRADLLTHACWPRERISAVRLASAAARVMVVFGPAQPLMSLARTVADPCENLRCLPPC